MRASRESLRTLEVLAAFNRAWHCREDVRKGIASVYWSDLDEAAAWALGERPSFEFHAAEVAGSIRAGSLSACVFSSSFVCHILLDAPQYIIILYYATHHSDYAHCCSYSSDAADLEILIVSRVGGSAAAPS